MSLCESSLCGMWGWCFDRHKHLLECVVICWIRFCLCISLFILSLAWNPWCLFLTFMMYFAVSTKYSEHFLFISWQGVLIASLSQNATVTGTCLGIYRDIKTPNTWGPWRIVSSLNLSFFSISWMRLSLLSRISSSDGSRWLRVVFLSMLWGLSISHKHRSLVKPHLSLLSTIRHLSGVGVSLLTEWEPS